MSGTPPTTSPGAPPALPTFEQPRAVQLLNKSRVGRKVLKRLQAKRQTQSVTELLIDKGRELGPIFEAKGLSQRTILIWGYPYVNEVCDDDRFDKALGLGLVALREAVGDGLFTAYTEEPNWGIAHRILLPAFGHAAMERYHPAMLDLASQLMLKWGRVNPGETVNVPEDMTRLTLDTIGLCGFGYRFNSFYRTDLHPYVQDMIDVLDAAMEVTTGNAAPDALAMNPKIAEKIAAMDALVDNVIATREASGSEGKQDLLQFMLDGVDKTTGEGLDPVTIRYEINTFLIAGHETTSGMLSFALYFLLKQPEVLAKAQAEADAILGTDTSVLPTFDQVRKLGYISQILKETLRLWPTAPGFTRRPLKDDLLAGTWPIAPTDVIRVITPLLHRDPAVWGDDVDVFRPERFAPELEAKLPPNAYKPFGTGQRACIGRQFAMHEATLVLGMLLQRFSFSDPNNYQLKIKQTLTIKPDNFAIGLVPREGRESFAFSAPEVAPTTTAERSAATAAGGGTPLLVLYGSNLGSTEDLAYRIANDGAARGYAPTVEMLDERIGAIADTGATIVLTASYNGTPPDNAAKFCSWLSSAEAGPEAAKGMLFTVFGCGNHEWASTYQAVPRLIDEGLAAHGGTRFFQRGEGDVAADFDAAISGWLEGMWPALASALGDKAPTAPMASGPLYTIEFVPAPVNPLIAEHVRPLKVVENRELQHGGERSTRHLEIALPPDMPYRTGDHLGIVPRNGVDLLERVLNHWSMAGDTYLRIARNGSGAPTLPLDQPIAAAELINRYVDVQEVASRAQVADLARRCGCPPEKAALEALASEAQYPAEVLAKRVSVLDLLERYPSVELPFAEYLGMLHPLRVRYYSISSSPAVDASTCSLTVAVVDAPARSGQGTYRGVASNYLARHPAGSMVDGYVRQPTLPFRPPADPTTPIIMVGPGTGLAPFMGFLQDRAAQLDAGTTLGDAQLFFGCRNPEQDFLYRDELTAWADRGVMTLHVAFSRPDSGEKRYVQDDLRANGERVWSLMNDRGIFYVCGDGSKMEPAVKQTLTEIAMTHGGMDLPAATARIDGLVAAERYLADVWSGTG